MDTLDNCSALDQAGQEQDLKFGITAENTRRIEKQNETRISVILGNPPYNASQQNYNEQNANRDYIEIDRRIKNTFIKASQVSNRNRVYDMYVRFYRWAMDRLDPRRGGIIAFVTNRNFLSALSFNGFRKCVYEDFDYIYIVDLGGDIRANYGKGLKISNVFDIQVGVCITFLVKTARLNRREKLFYFALNDEATKSEKLTILKTTLIENLPFETIYPDKDHNWLNQTDNDFEDLLPLCSKQTKNARTPAEERALFKLFCGGVKTGRDAWVYDFAKDNLERKVKFFINVYEQTRRNAAYEDKFLIKWDRELDKYRTRSIVKSFQSEACIRSLYRPFVKKQFYFDKHFNQMVYQNPKIFVRDGLLKNTVICFPGLASPKDFHVIASACLVDLNSLPAGAQCLPRYCYNEKGNKIDNITDWGLKQFQEHYPNLEISKDAIFDYVYGVLHCPNYRQTYEQNLKRDFPRIPFYKNFVKWAGIGKELLALHIDYEDVEPYLLQRLEVEVDYVKVKLKADKKLGVIELDSQTTLSGVPAEAWAYELGSRSALEWVLDQYKEKVIRDKTVAAKFNVYRFSDYKEEMIVLLQKVCRVSVETVKIIRSMPKS